MKKRKAILILLSSIILICMAAGFFMLRTDIYTLNTLKKINDYPFYEMTYKSDYGLDEFLKKGAGTDDELIAFITHRILRGLPIKAHANGACSTFTAVNEAGDNIFGRNFDYKKSSGLILKCAPRNGYKSIAIVNLAHIGYVNGKLPEGSIIKKISVLATPYVQVDGMNERGVAVAVLTLHNKSVHQKTGKRPITTTSAIRMILDKAASVNEAVKLLEDFDMNSSGTVGYHFQIADASGDSAVIEYVNGVMQVIRNDKPYLAATNFELYNNSNEGVGQDRYKIITEKLNEKKGILTDAECMELLKAVSCDNKKVTYADGQTTISNTQWSAVYNLDKLTVDICVGHDYSKTYTYSIK